MCRGVEKSHLGPGAQLLVSVPSALIEISFQMTYCAEALTNVPQLHLGRAAEKHDWELKMSKENQTN